MRANNLKSASATNISPVISVLMSCKKKVLTGKTSITSLFWDEFPLQVSTSADSQVARPSLACHFSEGVRSFLGCHTAQSRSSSRSPLGWSRCARTRYSRISRDRKQHSVIKAREFCFFLSTTTTNLWPETPLDYCMCPFCKESCSSS